MAWDIAIGCTGMIFLDGLILFLRLAAKSSLCMAAFGTNMRDVS
jgi:hypothetical protein